MKRDEERRGEVKRGEGGGDGVVWTQHDFQNGCT